MLCYNTIITVWTLQLEMVLIWWWGSGLTKPPSLSKMICNQHIVCLGTFIKRLASHLPNIIRRRLHDAGSPEAGTYNKTNLDDEPLQDRCPRVRGDLLWDFLQNLDMMQWQCGLQHPHQLQWIRTPSFLNIQCIFMSRIDFMSSSCFTMSGPVVASSGGKGREAQLIGCPTQVTSSRSVIQLDSEKISRIERCNETDR